MYTYAMVYMHRAYSYSTLHLKRDQKRPIHMNRHVYTYIMVDVHIAY